MTKNKKQLREYEVVHKRRYGVKELDLSKDNVIHKLFYNTVVAVELDNISIIVRPVFYDEYENEYHILYNDEAIIYYGKIVETTNVFSENVCKYMAQYDVYTEEDHYYNRRMLVWFFMNEPCLYMDKDNYEFFVDRNDPKDYVDPLLRYGDLHTNDLDMEGIL